MHVIMGAEGVRTHVQGHLVEATSDGAIACNRHRWHLTIAHVGSRKDCVIGAVSTHDVGAVW